MSPGIMPIGDWITGGSYLAAFTDHGVLPLFVPHRWQRCLHLRLPASALANLPIAKELV